MHVSGEPLDFCVDQNSDELIDGLIHGDELDRADVAIPHKVVEDLKAKTDNMLLIGGAGRCYKSRRHGGFVYVETRSHKAL